MVSQTLWIGITVGVFFVGLLVGFGAIAGTMNVGNMPMQNQMMNDPQSLSLIHI